MPPIFGIPLSAFVRNNDFEGVDELADFDLAGIEPADFGLAGFDFAGFEPAGFGPAGFELAGFAPPGLEPAVLEPAGFEPTGFEPAGFGPAGFEADVLGPAGFEPAGFGLAGFEPTGFELAGFEPTGFAPPSMELAGFEPAGFEPAGIAPPGMELTGFEPAGFEPAGFEPAGIAPPGLELTGFEPAGFGPAGFEPDIAALRADLEAGGSAAALALVKIRRSMPSLVFDEAGSSLVLCALAVAGVVAEGLRLMEWVAEGLRTFVGEAARSQSACRVLRQIVQSWSLQDSDFIAEELLAASPQALMLHREANVLLTCLIERFADDDGAMALVNDMLAGDVAELCMHRFGFHVARTILQHGAAEQRGRILSVLQGHVERLTHSRRGVRVYKRAFTCCPDSEQESLALAVIQNATSVTDLACHPYGQNVVRELFRVPSVSEHVWTLISNDRDRLSRDHNGWRLLRDMGFFRQRGGLRAPWTA